MPRNIIRLLSISAVLCLSAGAASADESSMRTAKTLFDAGEVHYKSGEYELAVTSYRKAYEIEPVPVLLFNIGQAYRLWGKPAEAADYYQQYLDKVPTGEVADAARQYLAEMKRKLAEQKPPPDEPDPDIVVDQPPPPEPEGSGLSRGRLASYILAGAGVITLGTGIGFGFRASGLSDEVSEVEEWTPENIDKIDAGERAETLSIVLTSTGAVLIGAGVVLFFVTGDSSTETPLAVTPSVGQQQVGVSLTGRF